MSRLVAIGGLQRVCQRTFLLFVVMVGLMVGLVAPAHALKKLPSFNVDIKESSASGVSAGGYMAGQIHVAYSSIIKGVGIIAGGPFNCAQGSLGQATTQAGSTDGRCMENPNLLSTAFIKQLYQDAQTMASAGKIDPLSNMLNDKVAIVHGSLDITVKPAVGNTIKPWYKLAGLPDANFLEIKGAWGHAHITDNWGNPCEFDTEPPWVSNCGIDASGKILEHIYGKLNSRKPLGQVNGRFIEFDQSEFVDPAPNSMQPKGVVYVPKSCDQGEACKLHVYFHGCEQVYDSKPADRSGDNAAYDCKGVWSCPYPVIGDTMWTKTGLNEWADNNNMIILYPQANKAYHPFNPKGCWDWWGYISTADKYEYATRNGAQMKAVYGMMERLSAGWTGSDDGDSDGDADGDGDTDGDGDDDNNHTNPGACPSVTGKPTLYLTDGLVVEDPANGLTYYKTSGDGQRVLFYKEYTIYIGANGKGYLTDPKNCGEIDEPQSYVVTATAVPTNGGFVSPITQNIAKDGVAQVQISVNPGYEISSATGCGGVISGETYTTAKIAADCQITVQFVKSQINNPVYYKVSITSSGPGAVTPYGVVDVEQGYSLDIKATPNGSNASVSGITGCGARQIETSALYTTYRIDSVTGNCSVNISFSEQIAAITVNSSVVGGGGRVYPAQQTVYAGEQAQVTVTPNSGYELSNVSGCPGTFSGNLFITDALSGAKNSMQCLFSFQKINSGGDGSGDGDNDGSGDGDNDGSGDGDSDGSGDGDSDGSGDGDSDGSGDGDSDNVPSNLSSGAASWSLLMFGALMLLLTKRKRQHRLSA